MPTPGWGWRRPRTGGGDLLPPTRAATDRECRQQSDQERDPDRVVEAGFTLQEGATVAADATLAQHREDGGGIRGASAMPTTADCSQPSLKR